jgi:hypothetical protein
MPYGPNGEWRPADPGAAAIHVAKIATGQIAETYEPPRDAEANHAAASKRASKAAKARVASQTPERRKQVAATAAAARWGG